MSNKFDKAKQVSSKCDDLNVEMKTSGKLICGCGGDNEFEYDPNLFDCRLFGLFLRKAENSHKKYQFVLSKLNLLETAIMEGKFQKTKDKVAETIREIINSDEDNTYNNETVKFIIDYMNDNAKNKQDFNRYQLMATLQSALNYVEISQNPQLSQLLTIVSNWVSKSDKMLKGVSVTQQEVNQELVLKPEEAGAQFQAKANKKTDTRDAGQLALQQQKPTKPYTSEDKFNKDKKQVTKIMSILNILNKALPGYFDPLSDKLNEYQNQFNSRDEGIYINKFRNILYSLEKERLLFDIFRKLNEQMNSILKDRTSEESKKNKESLKTIFRNYSSNIENYKKSNRSRNRNRFISDIYTFLLLSKEIENRQEFKALMENPSIGNSMKVKSIISNNLNKLLKEEYDDYSNDRYDFPLERSIFGTLNNITNSIGESGSFKDDAGLVSQLIEGKNDREKYINFDYNESSSSSS